MGSIEQADATFETESGNEETIVGGEEVPSHIIESDSSDSDDSQVSEVLLNSKSAFRVSVCLERYYTDVRARCYILVPRNRRVRWLQRRLQKLFPLLVNFHLSMNGHVLPPSEPLALLSPGDAIDVIPYQETRADLLDQGSLLPSRRRRRVRKRKSQLQTLSQLEYQSLPDFSAKDGTSTPTSIEPVQRNKDVTETSNPASPSMAQSLTDRTLLSPKHEVARNNTETLLNLKQQALALLESQVAVETNTTEPLDRDSLLPSRRRRRVRKRKTQMKTLSQLEDQSLPDFSAKVGTYTPTSIEPVPRNEDVIETSNPASPSMAQSYTDRTLLSPKHEVARNNTETLLNLKQQALALLESQVAVVTNTTEPLDRESSVPSRRRRRVRKRKTQLEPLSQLEYPSLPDFSAKDGTSTPTSIEPVQRNEDVTETLNPASPSMAQSSTDTVLLPPKHEVARNNTQTLLNLKQQALALLESQVAVETNTTEPLDRDSLLPSRRRRRVRKRKGQIQTLSQLEDQSFSDFSAKDGTSTPSSIEPEPRNEDITETLNPASPSLEQSSTDRVLLSPKHEVARNNAICSRKPRLVQSLNC